RLNGAFLVELNGRDRIRIIVSVGTSNLSFSHLHRPKLSALRLAEESEVACRQTGAERQVLRKFLFFAHVWFLQCIVRQKPMAVTIRSNSASSSALYTRISSRMVRGRKNTGGSLP